MTDEIRARIAQTIYGDGNEVAWPRAIELSDLIIWELGLRQETSHAWNGRQSHPIARRYTTEWSKAE